MSSQNEDTSLSGRRQAGRAMTKISFFFFFFSVSAAHSVLSAQTLNPTWKLYRFCDGIDFFFLQLKRQQSTHMLKGDPPDAPNHHFPENWASSGSFTLHMMDTQKETCVPEKGVFLFSTWRVYKKKSSSISYKNTCTEEKKIKLWLWQFCRRQKYLLEISE